MRYLVLLFLGLAFLRGHAEDAVKLALINDGDTATKISTTFDFQNAASFTDGCRQLKLLYRVDKFDNYCVLHSAEFQLTNQLSFFLSAASPGAQLMKPETYQCTLERRAVSGQFLRSFEIILLGDNERWISENRIDHQSLMLSDGNAVDLVTFNIPATEIMKLMSAKSLQLKFGGDTLAFSADFQRYFRLLLAAMETLPLSDFDRQLAGMVTTTSTGANP